MRLFRVLLRNRKFSLVRPGNVSPQSPPPNGVPLPKTAFGYGIPTTSFQLPFRGRRDPEIKNAAAIEAMRSAGKTAKQILDECGAAINVGVKTQEIDDFVMRRCAELGVYPAPLNYKGFPKAVCTSVNDVVCHGIPDDRPLEDGDVVNIDVTVFTEDGVHGDCSRTFAVGAVDDDGRKLLRVAEECLDVGVAVCAPGVRFSRIGCAIQRHAEENGFIVIPAFTGHGIGSFFHGPPDIFHFHNDFSGAMRAGMTFTVEPAIAEGDSDEIEILEDGWTAITVDGSRSAQFEHTILITDNGCDILTE